MKFLLSTFVTMTLALGLVTTGVAGGDKATSEHDKHHGASASPSVSPSTSGQDKAGQDTSASPSVSPSTSGQDKAGQDASASPKASGQDKAGQDASASPVTSGQDKSAEPGPVSKDECMNDGWQKFGGRFANEVECLGSISK